MKYEYDRNLFLQSIFEGDIVYFETAFPLEGEKISLLYPIEEVIAVTDINLKTIYEEGKDYIVEDHKLVFTKSSRIPQMSKDEYYLKDSPQVSIKVNKDKCPDKFDEDRYLFFSEGDGVIKHQITITYKHKPEPKLFTQLHQRGKLDRFFKKLENKEDTTIVFFGDSITVGCNATGTEYGGNMAPYTEPWPVMVTEYLKNKYQTNIKYVNTAVGGMVTEWGVNNYEERVNQYHPDLLVLAFGMNDGWLAKEKHFELILQIIHGVRAKNPECDIILVSTTVPNVETNWFGKQYTYIEEYKKHDLDHVAICDMTNTHFKLLERKRFKDMTGNDVNHPNDFLIRVYAQMILDVMEELK